MILEKDTRKLLIFSCLFTTYIVIGALVFQALEIGNEIEEKSLIRATREKLNQKYNISDEDWNKLERIMKQRYSLDSNTMWSFGNAFIFAGSVVTTVGKFKLSDAYGHNSDQFLNGRLFCTWKEMMVYITIKHTKQHVVFMLISTSYNLLNFKIITPLTETTQESLGKC